LQTEPIADYDVLRNGMMEHLASINGTQPGNPAKGCEIIVDVVRGEGRAKGKAFPKRLPFGPDAVEVFKERVKNYSEICEEWGEIVSSTNFD
jgi:hypothetical protein